MLTIKVDRATQAALISAIEGTRKQLPKELANAVNKTTARVRTRISKKIRDEVALSVADMKPILKVKGRATPRRIGAAVKLDHEKRFGIGGKNNRFKPEQTATGTKFKVSKKKRKSVIKGAFMGPKVGKLAPKLHGGVFKRTGPSRLPIVKLHGASPWGTYTKNRMDRPTRKWARNELRVQIEKRIATILKQKRLK